MHSLLLPIDEHWPLHDASQLVLQSPEQVTIPGFAVHIPMQSAVQLPVHIALADPEHMADALAVQLMGVHAAVQPPDVWKLQLTLVAPEKSMLPHAATGAAWATLGASDSTLAVTIAAIADRTVRWLMGDLTLG